MKLDVKHCYWVAVSLAAVAFGATPTKAIETGTIGLSFDLNSSGSSEAASDTSVSEVAEDKPLDMPSQAGKVPIGSADSRALAKLPPPPNASINRATPTLSNVAVAPQPAPAKSKAESPKPAETKPVATAKADTGILNFDDRPIAATPVAASPRPASSAATAERLRLPAEFDAMFRGNSDSLVARAVGSAEGTRTPDGGRTRFYRGHVDPGNGVWNLGTFSYQHGARSPEEADVKQLKRLRRQAQTLRQQAQARGIELTLEEELNGIDLANQSPRAALSPGGYVDRLKQARDMGLQGTDAVLWARTRAYLDPNTGRWNAPGLGNTTHSITRDQERRLKAVARAIEARPVAHAEIDLDRLPESETPLASSTQSDRSAEQRSSNPKQDTLINQILSLDLPPS